MIKINKDGDFFLNLLRDYDAILKGHFAFGETHTDVFIDNRLIRQHATLKEQIARQIFLQLIMSREEVRTSPESYTIVADKSGAGILRDIGTVATFFHMRYARVRDHGEEASFSKAQLPRITGQSVIILNDFLTNGRSLVKMRNAVIEAGGHPAFAVALWNRGNVHLDHLPIKAFINRRLDHWHAHDCPLCKQGDTNLTIIGQRKPR